MQHPDRLYRRVKSVNEMDSIRLRKKAIQRSKRDMALVEVFRDLWLNMEPFREQRARAFRFAYDDQWGDLMEYNGKVMTMRQYLQQTGNIVVQSNQVQEKVETMVGVITREMLEPQATAVDTNEQAFGEIVSKGLQVNCKKNCLNEVYLDWGRELCLGGLMVGYETWDSTSGPDGTFDSWTSYVNPNLFIMDCMMSDSRMWDATKFGRMIKCDAGKLAATFARSADDYAILRSIYPEQFNPLVTKAQTLSTTDRYKQGMLSWMEDEDPSVCVVLEAWTKETKARIRVHDWNEGKEYIIDADDKAERQRIKQENRRRHQIAESMNERWTEDEIPYITGDGIGDSGFFIDEFWYCRFLAPDGTILWEGESPLPGRNQPFVVRTIPMIDGKIQGFLYPVIDHNIIMNRAIVLHDWLLRAQAKGVTVVPKSVLGGVDPKEFAKSWTEIGGLVFVDIKPGQEKLMPQSFHSNAINFDVSRYLQTFASMSDKSTAITDALQGKTPFAGASGTLYAQMASNSTTTVAAFLLKFHKFLEVLHTKKMQNLLYFYDRHRWEMIVGQLDGEFDLDTINLDDLRYIHCDLNIQEGTETPAFREIAEQDAKQMLEAGLITFDEYALISKRPWMQKLKQYRDARQQAAEDANVTPGQPVTIPQSQRPQSALAGVPGMGQAMLKQQSRLKPS